MAGERRRSRWGEAAARGGQRGAGNAPRHDAGRARPRTVDGSTSVSAAALQLYDKRYASLSAASQSSMLSTVTPKQEQPAAKQCTRAA